MARTKKSVAVYPTELVFAAACAADRFNKSEYVSTSDYSDKATNKSLVIHFLKNSLEITAADHAKAALVIQNYQALTLKILKGKILSEFESKAMELASGETISERDIGVVAYLPVGYARAQVVRSVDQRLRDCESAYCGAVDSKVSLSIEILKNVYSQNYNCYFITAITKDNLAVSFATSNGHYFVLNNTYNVTAKVKAHFEQSVTKLNFVKIQQKD